MSDGMSDARREAEIVGKIDHGLTLFEEAFDDGGYDRVFGVNDAILREMNARLKKYGLEVYRRRKQ